MTRYRYCEHCCKRVPSEGNHTCRPPSPERIVPAPPESTPAPARFIENLKPAETEHATEEEGISAEEAARLGYELSAERREPTTEEGEERCSLGSIINYQEFKGIKYVLLDTHLAAIAARDAAVTRMHEQDTWAAVCMEERDAAQEEVRNLKEEKEQKRKDHADGWWLNLNLEELREEFACLEELECENQAAVAELGAHCLEKSTDGIWTLGNMLHDERAEVSRLRELLQVAEGALEFYAGEAKDAHWEKAVFFAYDKFGGIDTDASGPLVAREALARLRSGKGGGKNG